MSIIVQKFGGTSLRNPLGLQFLLSHVEQAKSQDQDLVIVVSSMGRRGDPYATDTLINELEKINNNIDSLTKDLIMSCGEVISTALVSHFLNSNGIETIPLTGFQAGILTDNNFNSAKILDIDTKRILKHLSKGKVIVIAGFQGITPNLEITTLGRGGSDITAVSLGGFLGANRVDIFTDVEGVAIVDPRIIPSTEYIKTISYSNMYKLSSSGANVIHPRAVLLAEKYKIPVHISSTFDFNEGTIISDNEDYQNREFIGISLDNKTYLQKNIDKVSIYLTKNLSLKTENKLKTILLDINTQIYNLIWNNNIIQFKVDSKNSRSIVKRFYRILK